MRRASSALDASMSAASRLRKTKVAGQAAGPGEGPRHVVLVVGAGKDRDQRARPGERAAARRVRGGRRLAEQGAARSRTSARSAASGGAFSARVGKIVLERPLPVALQLDDVEVQVVDADHGLGQRVAQDAERGAGEEAADILAFRHFQEQRADGRGEQIPGPIFSLKAKPRRLPKHILLIASASPPACSDWAARILPWRGQVVHPGAVLLEACEIGHLPVVARQRQQHHPAPRFLEFRARARGARRPAATAKATKVGGTSRLPEGARHAVLAADGRDGQPLLGGEGPQQGGEGQAPAPRVAAGLGEIFLQAQAHAAQVAAAGRHAGHGLDDGVNAAHETDSRRRARAGSRRT